VQGGELVTRLNDKSGRKLVTPTPPQLAAEVSDRFVWLTVINSTP
jgi:hypothetical protein